MAAHRQSLASAAPVAILLFVVALGVRLGNAETAFAGGEPRVPPLDDLYHAKRIAFSAAHFPRVLEWDPDRGVNGAFCPWPPLYDLGAALFARATGAATPRDVLARVIWLPPVSTALFVGVLAALVSVRLGRAPALVAGSMLALSPPLVEVSRLASIDHHFLEPPLLLGVLGATLGLRRAGSRPCVSTAGLLLGMALLAALFVQPALLVAGAVSFAVVLLLDVDDLARLLAAALGFGIAAFCVWAYRVGRPSGYPDSEWFLGAPHAAALLAASVSCATAAVLHRSRRAMRRALALLAGLAVVCLIPGALDSSVAGARFFGGDPWLSSIEEFQPVLAGDQPARAFAIVLGGAVLLVVPFAWCAWRGGDRSRRALASFAVAYVGATLASRRFAVTVAPLLALVSAVLVLDLLAQRRRWLAGTAAAVALGPLLVTTLPELRHPPNVVPPRAEPMLRAAAMLRSRADEGRVLGPWSWGHVFDVAGRHPVIVDNFGVAPSPREFEDALVAPLADEESLARYCERARVKYVVLESPFTGIVATLEDVGSSIEPFFRPPPTPGGAYAFTRLSLASFWWRGYYDRGLERPEAGVHGRAFRRFRLLYEDRETVNAPGPYRGPAVEIWELVEDSGTSATARAY